MPNRNHNFDDRQRVYWVDYCRGVGIFLVVVSHVLAGLQPSGIISDSPWYQFVEEWLYTFHMPLFFFISGLFVQRSARRPFPGFILDKAAVLVYPYFVWSILQGLLQTSHLVNHPLPVIALLNIWYVPIDQYWFFYTLFVSMIIYRLFYQISPSGIAFFSLTIIFFVIEQLGINIIQWDVAHAVGSFLIYFGAGVAVARSSILVRLAELRNPSLLAICIGGYVAVTIGVATHSVHHPAILRLGWAIAGIVATVAFAILISRSPKFAFAKLWGVLSLEIYVAHVIAAATIRITLQTIFGFSEPLLHFVIGTGVGIYAPILLAYICQRIGAPYAFTLSRSRLEPWIGSSLGKRSTPSARIKA
jgi:fucose 4-O-acetylase-like acetyltransferase